MVDPTALLEESGCYVAITDQVLQPLDIMQRVRSPEAGAIVLFAGTTRSNFAGKPVKELQYQSYTPLALRTMLSIAQAVKIKHSLQGVAMVHRLGPVPIGEESILIAVSAQHRQAAWLAGEEALEDVKARVEIWKMEIFHGDEGGVWRANRDGAGGERVPVEGVPEMGEEKTKSDDGPAVIGENEGVPKTMGPLVRPRRPGEFGHGAVVNRNLGNNSTK